MHAHAACSGHTGAGRRELLELDRHRRAWIKLLDLLRDRACERLEQAERRFRAERDDDLADLEIVHGVGDAIRLRRGTELEIEREVDAKSPRATPFRRGVAVVALEFEAAHEDGVHARTLHRVTIDAMR